MSVCAGLVGYWGLDWLAFVYVSDVCRDIADELEADVTLSDVALYGVVMVAVLGGVLIVAPTLFGRRTFQVSGVRAKDIHRSVCAPRWRPVMYGYSILGGMMIVGVLGVLIGASDVAWATPVELTHQGRLLDAAGAPVNDDEASLTFDVLEAGPPLVERWSEGQDVVIEDGYYTVILGADSGNPLQAEWFSDDPLLRVTDGGGAVLASQVIRPVPTALSSYSVSGGPVDASELRVDGTAAWVAPSTPCAATTRGAIRFVAGTSGTADGLEWCADDGTGALAWRPIGGLEDPDPSGGDINPPGTLLIASSGFVDPNPPTGWTQCAGFKNTSGNDVTDEVLDGCLPVNRMRIRMWNAAGILVDDQLSEAGNNQSSWPSWTYVTGSRTNVNTTYWTNTAGFFATMDGRDACGHSTGGSTPHLGTGNGSCAGIFPGHSNPAHELGRNCSGSPYVDFTIAVYR